MHLCFVSASSRHLLDKKYIKKRKFRIQGVVAKNMYLALGEIMHIKLMTRLWTQINISMTTLFPLSFKLCAREELCPHKFQSRPCNPCPGRIPWWWRCLHPWRTCAPLRDDWPMSRACSRAKIAPTSSRRTKLPEKLNWNINNIILVRNWTETRKVLTHGSGDGPRCQKISGPHVAAGDAVVSKLLLLCPVHVPKVWMTDGAGLVRARGLNRHLQLNVEGVLVLVS